VHALFNSAQHSRPSGVQRTEQQQAATEITNGRNNMNIQSKAILLSLMPAMAQTSHTGSQTTPATVNQRKQNQQDRIAYGIQSGQLTAGEAGKPGKKRI